jgi:hypothetical protein
MRAVWSSAACIAARASGRPVFCPFPTKKHRFGALRAQFCRACSSRRAGSRVGRPIADLLCACSLGCGRFPGSWPRQTGGRARFIPLSLWGRNSQFGPGGRAWKCASRVPAGVLSSPRRGPRSARGGRIRPFGGRLPLSGAGHLARHDGLYSARNPGILDPASASSDQFRSARHLTLSMRALSCCLGALPH